MKASNISLCVIDDCGDADLPILEVALSNFKLKQFIKPFENGNDRISPNRGTLKCTLASDYYNRILSGWEPIVEPWKWVVPCSF